MEERFVWWLWQTRRFDASAARAAGQDVIFPGWFSTGAGPDFRDALIAGGLAKLEQGDVEIHVTDSAWKTHGHHEDPNYDNVILHVVLRRDSTAPTWTSSGKAVSILELEPLLTASLNELELAFGNWTPGIVRCPVDLGPPSILQATIEKSGTRRFRDKVKRAVADSEVVGKEEALYRSLAESLGYSANRKAFRRIAEALPFALLSSLTLYQIEQLLLAAAGLAHSNGLLTSYLDGPVLHPGELVTFRVRPANNPVTRLRGLARLIATHRRGLTTMVRSVPVEELWHLFVVEADSVLVGRGRADDIVLNVALPYLAAYCDVDSDAALARLPAPTDNRWVKSLRNRLSASGVTMRPYKALHQQGLLELSLRFCRYDHCEACPLHADPAKASSAWEN